MELLDLMKSRYSERKYNNKVVEKEILDQILEAGRVAPTGANRQTQRILVVNNKDLIEKISKGSRTYNSSTVLIICSEHEQSWVNPHDGRDLNDIDCSIVSTHMMLMAKNLGVDSIWINWINPEILHDELNIPKKYKIINILLLGYTDSEAKSATRHDTERKSINETVFYNQII